MTTQPPHAPTPWAVHKTSDDAGVFRVMLESCDGSNVALMKSVRNSERNSFGAVIQSKRSESEVDANAAFTVEAVNAYDALKKANEELLDACKYLLFCHKNDTGLGRINQPPPNPDAIRQAEQAIARAEKGV